MSSTVQFYLFSRDNGQYYLIGIVSHGPIKCGTEPGAVYTMVRHYVDWIKQTRLDLMAEELRKTSIVPMSKLDEKLNEEIVKKYLNNRELKPIVGGSLATDICSKHTQRGEYSY